MTTAAIHASRRKLWSQCQKKTRYRSQHEATLYARKSQQHGSGELHSYYCALCDGWHLSRGPGY